MKHKVISLLQPWASLVVMGHKHIETRSFQRSYRGPLLIHASLGKGSVNMMVMPHFVDYLPHGVTQSNVTGKDMVYPLPDQLPYGAIIGSVNLIDIIPSENSYGAEHVAFNGHTWKFSPQEKAFGDYSAGRFLWLLSDPVMFKEPVPARGNLGIWEWEGDIPA